MKLVKCAFKMTIVLYIFVFLMLLASCSSDSFTETEAMSQLKRDLCDSKCISSVEYEIEGTQHSSWCKFTVIVSVINDGTNTKDELVELYFDKMFSVDGLVDDFKHIGATDFGVRIIDDSTDDIIIGLTWDIDNSYSNMNIWTTNDNREVCYDLDQSCVVFEEIEK